MKLGDSQHASEELDRSCAHLGPCLIEIPPCIGSAGKAQHSLTCLARAHGRLSNPELRSYDHFGMTAQLFSLGDPKKDALLSSFSH